MSNTYLAGTLVRVATYFGPVSSPSGGFRDASGNFGDPEIVILKYRPGAAASVVTLIYPVTAVVRDGTGLYHADLDTSAFPTDTWTFTWTGSGPFQAVAEGSFLVQAVPF